MSGRKVIDLRSDTVTKPTEAMRLFMCRAEVGDDVFGEDPTVIALQNKVARLLEKERALFVVSGTMSNEIAVKVHTLPGDGVIVEKRSHILIYECGAPSVISGVQLYPLEGLRGIMTAQQVKAAINPSDVHQPRTRLICLENTHNKGGGVVYPLDEIRRIQKVALTNGLRMHLDGARLFNAVAATGIPAYEYARYFDSVSICLSKGLGAPIGSVIAGSDKFIDEALRVRKLLGGGWRQAGILAAAGIYALDNNRDRLVEDHENAKRLWRALHDYPGVEIEGGPPETNIVIMNVEGLGVNASDIQNRLAEQGVLVIAFSPIHIRLVTHLEVTEKDCDTAAERIRDVLAV